MKCQYLHRKFIFANLHPSKGCQSVDKICLELNEMSRSVQKTHVCQPLLLMRVELRGQFKVLEINLTMYSFEHLQVYFCCN